MLEGIDIHVDVPRVDYEKLSSVLLVGITPLYPESTQSATAFGWSYVLPANELRYYDIQCFGGVITQDIDDFDYDGVIAWLIIVM